MKKIRNILSVIALSAAFIGCEKEIMDYEGQDAIYFDVQYGKSYGNENFWIHQLYSVVAFGDLDEDEYNGSLKINVAGHIKDYDRTFKVEVVKDSTTAKIGDEFEFSEEQVVKAGERLTRLQYKAKRSQRMSEDTLKVQLRLLPSEDFTLPFSEVGRIPGRWEGSPDLKYNQNFDPTVHTIYMHNFINQPEGWYNTFGDFSLKKYELMLELTGLTKIQFANSEYILELTPMITNRVSRYLMEQYNLGYEHWVIDEDGTMMWVKGVIWENKQDPELMNKN